MVFKSDNRVQNYFDQPFLIGLFNFALSSGPRVGFLAFFVLRIVYQVHAFGNFWFYVPAKHEWEVEEHYSKIYLKSFLSSTSNRSFSI